MKRRFVEALVRLYPARWRREFGGEFTDVLMSRPLGWSAAVDVAWNAGRQQLRLGEPWVILGVPLLALNLWTLPWLILYPPPGGVLEWLNSTPSALLSTAALWLAGFWTVLRHGKAGGGGRAAMKLALLTTWPLTVAGVLSVSGILRTAPAPSQSLVLIFLPLINLPFAGIPGWIGGLMGRGALRWQRRPASE